MKTQKILFSLNLAIRILTILFAAYAAHESKYDKATYILILLLTIEFSFKSIKGEK